MSEFALDASASNDYVGENATISVSMDCLQATSGAVEDTWGMTLADLGVSEAQTSETGISTVELTKDGEFVFGSADLFGSFKNMVPGESREQTLKITNNREESVAMTISALTEAGRTKGVETFLKDYASLKISDENGSVLYSGPADGSGVSRAISIGDFAPGETKTLSVNLSVDSKAGNEHQNLSAENVKWTFTAKGESGADTGTTGQYSSSNGHLTKTCDYSNIITYCLMASAASVLMAIALWLYGRKKAKQCDN